MKKKEEKMEKRFDEKFATDKRWGDSQSNQWELAQDIKSFIRSLLSQERHDHEILVNSILETKNKEIKEERLKVLEEVEKAFNGQQLFGQTLLNRWRFDELIQKMKEKP